jgi:hypothetical protein
MEVLGKTSASATLSTINPTRVSLGLNPDLQSEMLSIPKIIQHLWHCATNLWLYPVMETKICLLSRICNAEHQTDI